MAREIEKLKPLHLSKLEQGMHGDGGNLWLQVTPTGRSWIFRFTLHGRAREMGLGSLNTFSLSEARQQGRLCRQQVHSGIDPIEARKAARLTAQLDSAKAVTFEECSKRYIASHQAAWRNAKHSAQWASTLQTYAFPVFGKLPTQAVDVGLVLKAIEPIWATKPETASRLRGRIESILDWATARGYRQGENPARWRGHLENLLPARAKVRSVQHHAALPYAQIFGFITKLRRQDGVAARALEFAIFTAARTGEVIGARWDEINTANKLWTIPAHRMGKSKKEHRVPLSDAALEIVDHMAEHRTSDFVFPGNKAKRPLSNMALLMTLRRMKREDLTAHGFRSSFRDWAAECTDFPTEVAEMALAHTVADKVEAAYRRGDLLDKRRQLAEAWARYCAQPTAREVALIRSGVMRPNGSGPSHTSQAAGQ
jgi:integrase